MPEISTEMKTAAIEVVAATDPAEGNFRVVAAGTLRRATGQTLSTCLAAIDWAMHRPQPELQMATWITHLRDLRRSLIEYPAEWPDELLTEVGNLAYVVEGAVNTERLTRSLTRDMKSGKTL